MKIAIVVQARLGSTRMPQKIVKPFFDGKSILDLLIEKLRLLECGDIVIATSVNEQNDLIEQIAKSHGVHCFRGSENNVLNRFISAAKTLGFDYILRICSDNPFLEFDSLARLLDYGKSNPNFDYVGYRIDGTPSIKTHYGFWAEFVSLAALEKVESLTDDTLYQEHVTNYIYSHPQHFNISWIDVDKQMLGDNIRLTIDTQKDFELSSRIYEDFVKFNHKYTVSDVVGYLKENSHLFELMKKEIENNEK